MIVLMTIAPATTHFEDATIWWIDSIAALMAVVRGCSNNSELDQMAGAIHAFLVRCPLVFVWVHSPDHWSDGISRRGIGDDWPLPLAWLFDLYVCSMLVALAIALFDHHQPLCKTIECIGLGSALGGFQKIQTGSLSLG